MQKQNTSKARKAFRKGLYALMACSFLFFIAIVFLRVNKDAQRYIIKNHSDVVFHYDVLQHQALANLEDPDGKYQIAVTLFNKGFFSSIYSDAGIQMIKMLADNGHPEAQMAHANILLRTARTSDQYYEARYYYYLAAQEGHQPAIEKLAYLHASP